MKLQGNAQEYTLAPRQKADSKAPYAVFPYAGCQTWSCSAHSCTDVGPAVPICRRGVLFPRTIALPITLDISYHTDATLREQIILVLLQGESQEEGTQNKQNAPDKHASMHTTARTCTTITQACATGAVRAHVPKGAHTCQKGQGQHTST